MLWHRNTAFTKAKLVLPHTQNNSDPYKKSFNCKRANDTKSNLETGITRKKISPPTHQFAQVLPRIMTDQQDWQQDPEMQWLFLPIVFEVQVQASPLGWLQLPCGGEDALPVYHTSSTLHHHNHLIKLMWGHLTMPLGWSNMKWRVLMGGQLRC